MISTVNKKLYAQRAGAILFALALWQFAAMALGQKMLLASPVEVLARLGTIWMEDGFFSTIWFSFRRIVSGFFLGFLLGVMLGVVAGRLRFLEILLWPFVVTIKSIPVASFVIISLIWLSASQLSVFISFLMVFPVIYSNVLQGIKSTDRDMLEMAELYQLSFPRRLFYIHMPHLKPFLLSACSVSLGLSWKSGVAAEVIGIPSGSMGEMLYESKVYFATADLFAWTVIIVLISVGFEKLFMWALKFLFRRLERL